jgi:glycosyltransferase involved in cell wall biosynthesis
MKRILHIPKFYSPHNGGIESTCKYIVSNLPLYEHLVICFSESNSTYSDIVEGVNVRRVGSFCKIASQNITFVYFFELKKILQDFKPDLVHFHAPNPLIMVYLLKLLPKSCKLIVHWHSDIVAQKNIYQLVRPFERWFLQKADTIFITSPNYLNESNPLQPVKNKVTVVASAIDPTLFSMSPEEQIQSEKLKEKYQKKYIVFFIGRHVPYKGLKYLLEAEKNIQNDCRILIAGQGPLTASLQKKYQTKRIEFLGKISDKDLKIFLHIADVLAFPSITKNEAFGLVLAEAMYCETPAVTFTIPGSGVNWVNLNKVTGIEVENSNSLQFANAIDSLLSDDEQRLIYAQNAKQRVLDNFTMDKIKIQIRNIYQELLNTSYEKK